MKQRGKSTALVLAGILIGCIFSGPVARAASELVNACRSDHRVYVDGKPIALEAYVIAGNNYVKLRDVGVAVDFNVWWDEASRTVQIESGKPYTGAAPAADKEDFAPAADSADFTPEALTGPYTREACEALHRTLRSGTESQPACMTEETHTAMLEAAAAIGSWPVYDLKPKGSGRYSFTARYPEAYAEAAEYCRLFIENLAGQSDRERVRQLAFFVCDRIEYSGSTNCTPRTALVSDAVQKGACVSYAHCFQFLCDLAGIPCILVHSDDHQWNAVYVEERWWEVDVTGVDAADPTWRDELPVLREPGELQGSLFIQSQPQLTRTAKELLVPGSTK